MSLRIGLATWPASQMTALRVEKTFHATGPTYHVVVADLGKQISFQVTATSDGRHASTFSAATAPVTLV